MYIWYVNWRCQRLQVFHALINCWKLCNLWYHERKVCFCYLTGCLLAFFKDVSPSTYCGDGLIMWIPFSKATQNEEERTELCWYVGAMLYLTNFWWLLRLLITGSGNSFVWYSTLPCFSVASRLWKDSFIPNQGQEVAVTHWILVAKNCSLDLLHIVFWCLLWLKKQPPYGGVFIDRMMDSVFEDDIAYYHLRIIFFSSDEAYHRFTISV